jgi:uncharacterized protein (TIGR03066 family)
MAVLRVVLVGVLLLAVANVGLAQKEKTRIDKDKLVGTWTLVKTSEKEGVVAKVVFTKDGTVTVEVKEEDKTVKHSGTYTVKGDQMTITAKDREGKEEKHSATIKELTDKKLVVVRKIGDKTITSEFKK